MKRIALQEDAVLLIEDLPTRVKGQKRQEVERATIAQLLEKHFAQGTELAHYPNGKPYLPKHEDWAISISHSDAYAGLLLAPKKLCLGLDIEDRGEQVLRVRERFLDSEEDELVVCSADELLALHLVWSAKECLYKAENTSESYLKAYKLEALSIEEEEERAVLLFRKQERLFQVQAFYTQAYVLTYYIECL